MIAEDELSEERLPFHRGPGRGDGFRRRSITWLRAREESLNRPCPFVYLVRSPRGLGSEPRRIPCGAGIGQLCRNRHGEVLERFPAHGARLGPTPSDSDQDGSP